MRSAVLFLVVALSLSAQRTFSGAPESMQSLDRLYVVGSVLMIAAHPDDENTGVIATLARGKKVRTAYLSLNRGEGRENVLRDVVWVIRKYRPDVIIRRFSGTPDDGHGHHQTSALIADEAFEAAADPKRFPEQLKFVEPWQAKRLVWNSFGSMRQIEQDQGKQPGKVAMDVGDFESYLGYSYGEIAGWSRSQHRSQAMGAAERKGSQMNYFTPIKGEAAKEDLWEGIDTTWNRVPGGAPVGDLLARAAREFDGAKPTAVLPHLLAARKLLTGKTDHYSVLKRRDLDETIAMVAGLWTELQAPKYKAIQVTKAAAQLAMIGRS